MGGCRQYCVGFANYDTPRARHVRRRPPGYEVISKFRDLPYDPILGLGVLDIHTDFIESPELVRDRILYAVDVFGDPARIHVCPDCGLRTRSWDVAYEKLAHGRGHAAGRGSAQRVTRGSTLTSRVVSGRPRRGTIRTATRQCPGIAYAGPRPE